MQILNVHFENKFYATHLEDLFRYLGYVTCGIKAHVTNTRAYLGLVVGNIYKLVEQEKGLNL